MDNRIVDSNEKVIGDLLNDNMQYNVPKYQRDYSWGDEHIEDFLEDLLRQTTGVFEPSHNYYFFGTCYLILNNNDNSHSIVDGQQRIATIMIFFAAVRDLLIENRPDEAEKITSKIMNSNKKPRLSLNENDNDLFTRIIIDKNKHQIKMEFLEQRSEINPKLFGAYEKIYDTLKEKMDNQEREESFNHIINIAQYLEKYFVVLVNTVDNEEIAQNIFDTVNRRGKRLTESDYVKNKLLEIATMKGLDAKILNGKWTDLRQTINDTKENESHFLRHYLIAHHTRVSRKRVPDEIQRIAKEELEVDKLIDDIDDSATNYFDLMLPNNDRFNEKTVYALESLKAIRSESVYPVLLAGLKAKYSDQEIQQLANTVLLFFFRTKTIGKRESNQVEIALAKICEDIRTEKPQIDKIKNNLRNHHIYSNDSDFESRIRAYKPTNTAARYMLIELEEESRKRNKMEKLKNKNELLKYYAEYIMPEKNNSDWLKELKSKGTSQNKYKKYHSQNSAKIHNRVLVNDQPTPKTHINTFEGKKAKYKNSILKTTSDVFDYEKWDQEIMNERLIKFIKMSRTIWKL